MFVISYLEDAAFDFVKTYLNDYNANIENIPGIRKEIQRIFRKLTEFIKILKEVYGKLYKKEKVIQ